MRFRLAITASRINGISKGQFGIVIHGRYYPYLCMMNVYHYPNVMENRSTCDDQLSFP